MLRRRHYCTDASFEGGITVLAATMGVTMFPSSHFGYPGTERYGHGNAPQYF